MANHTTPLNQPNYTGYFYPADDKWEIKQLPFKASTAITQGTAIGIEISSNTTTGYVTKMGTENANGADFMGIMAETIATTDTDYATAWKLKWVWVPKTPYALSYFKVGSGTFTAVDVFKTVEIYSDSVSLAVDTAWKGARIMWYIDSTHGLCRFDLPSTETA